MIKKPCYECFSSDNEVEECLEGMDEDYNCLILKKGGCWDTCKSGKMSDYYISELDYEKARHKKGRNPFIPQGRIHLQSRSNNELSGLRELEAEI